MNAQDFTPENERYAIKHVERLDENIICIIKSQGGMSHLCGYVGVPYESNLFGLSYIGWLESKIDVHGGLTYSTSESSRMNVVFGKHKYPICIEAIWWFGFDCNHVDDLPQYGGYRKSEEFALSECRSLSKQLTYLNKCLGEIEIPERD